MNRLRAVAVGVAAALAAPWHLEGAKLKRLLQGGGATAHPREAHTAIWSANRAIQVLARLPGSHWRNTCLYRSVAGALAIRWLGGAAIVRIGARRDPITDDVLAHAWIEGLTDETETGPGYAVLSAGIRANS